MKIVIIFSVIFVILIETESVLSQRPTCGVYDFNDPSILSKLQDCTALPELDDSRPLVTKSFSNSTKFSPFRPDSQFFLTTNKSVHYNTTQCISTTALFRGSFASFSFRIGINLKNNNNTDEYNDVQLFVSKSPAFQAFQINAGTTGWQSYEKNYSFPKLGTFDDSVIGLKVRIGNNSNLAVEYIKFYDPQITDENCVPLYTSTTSTPEITTKTAKAGTTEAGTTETGTTNASTTKANTTVASATEAGTTEAGTTEPKTTAILDADFNNSTSLLGKFTACYLEYLPQLVIKSYSTSTILPYRTTSTFYLTNKWEGYSCLETIPVFSLTEANYIESVIFLNGVWDGAWIEISIVDQHTGKREVLKKLERNSSWIRISEKIKGNYSDAKIYIRTNMNSYSQLAMEYFTIRSNST